MHILVELDAQCILLVEKMTKFNAIEDEMMSIMSALKKENEDLKMDLIRGVHSGDRIGFGRVSFG